MTRLFSIIFIYMFASLPAFGQGSPVIDDASGALIWPENFFDANNVVQTDNNGAIKYPSNFIQANGLVTASGGQLSFLTPGGGISGSAFNGSLPQEWKVAAGEGVFLDANGAVAVNKTFVREIAREVASGTSDVQIVIDTTPSVNPYDAFITKTATADVSIDFTRYTYTAVRVGANDAALVNSPEVITNEDGSKTAVITAKNQLIRLPSSVGFGPSMTLSFRMRVRNLDAITRQYFITSGYPKLTAYIGPGILVFQYAPDKETPQRQFVFNLTDENWHTYSIVANGDTLKFYGYKDGNVKSAETAITSVPTVDALDGVLNFQADAASTSPVEYADIRYFRRALTADEARAYHDGEYLPDAVAHLANDIEGNIWYNTLRPPLNYGLGEANASNRAFSAIFSFDVPKMTYWSDGEFKALDAGGNMVYWVSTQWGGQMAADYENHPARDPNAKIYYAVAGSDNDGREWVEYVHSAETPTIYAHAQSVTGLSNPIIGNIKIIPNLSGATLGGTSINAIFNAQDGEPALGKSFIILKCSPTGIERSPEGRPVWRITNVR